MSGADSIEQALDGHGCHVIDSDRSTVERHVPRTRPIGRFVEDRRDHRPFRQPLEPVVRDDEHEPPTLVATIGEPDLTSRRNHANRSIQASVSASMRLRAARSSGVSLATAASAAAQNCCDS